MCILLGWRGRGGGGEENEDADRRLGRNFVARLEKLQCASWPHDIVFYADFDVNFNIVQLRRVESDGDQLSEKRSFDERD